MRRYAYATLILTLLVTSVVTARTEYAIQDLGVLPGDTESRAWAINGRGHVVCASYSDIRVNREGTRIARVFVWKNGHRTEIVLPHRVEAVLRLDIDIHGRVMIATSGHAYIYGNGVLTEFPKLPGDVVMRPQSMNGRGDVVGVCKTYGDDKPFIWRNGRLEELAVPENCFVFGNLVINDRGQIATSIGLSGKYTAMRWKDGSPEILHCDAEVALVNAIAPNGSLVGQWNPRHRDEAFVCCDSRLENALREQDRISAHWAQCVNASGLMAGIMESPDYHDLHPAVWDRSGVVNKLQTLGGRAGEAMDMNCQGRIVGWAHDSREVTHAVMWTPVK